MVRDPRRRFYVVTLRLAEGESAEDCDRRLVEALGPRLSQNAVTVSVYEPAADAFHALGVGKQGIERGVARPRPG